MDGKNISGVAVATIIVPTSLALICASFNAFFAATIDISEVAVFSSTKRRSLIPVRVVIHSSDVSTIFSKSALVTTLSGTYMPIPAIYDFRLPP